MESIPFREYLPVSFRPRNKRKKLVCPKCGNCQESLHPIFQDLCLVCLRDWAIKQGVPVMIPEEVLENMHPSDKPTEIIHRKCRKTDINTNK